VSGPEFKPQYQTQKTKCNFNVPVLLENTQIFCPEKKLRKIIFPIHNTTEFYKK
jgi:hypothetical protein